MRTPSSTRPQSSGRGAGRSTNWVRTTPAEPGAPTMTSGRRAMFTESYGPRKCAHTGGIWAAGSSGAGFESDVLLSLPGELDHATGPVETTIDNPKGPTGPRPDSVKAECQHCGRWKGLRRSGDTPLLRI